MQQQAFPPGREAEEIRALGGRPGAPDFTADAYLTGLDKLAAIGVTWVQVGLPGDSLAHALETIDRFGELVIAKA